MSLSGYFANRNSKSYRPSLRKLSWLPLFQGGNELRIWVLNVNRNEIFNGVDNKILQRLIKSEMDASFEVNPFLLILYLSISVALQPRVGFGCVYYLPPTLHVLAPAPCILAGPL